MRDYKKLFFAYLDQVWRRRWTALIFAWAVCAVGWPLIALLPDKYASEARVYVDTQSLLNPLLKGISVRADDPRREEDVEIMQRTLTSRPNLVKVAQITDLDKRVTSAADLQGLIDKLEERIEVTNQGNNLFRVEFTDNSPAMAKRVVQALLTIFVENNVGDRRADMQTARSFIENQLSDYDGKLRAAEKELADFKVANMDYLSGPGENFSGRLEGARNALKQRTEELQDLMDQRTQLKTQIDNTPQFLSVDAIPQVVMGGQGSPTQQRIRELQNRISELRLQYTDKHPEIVRSLEELKQLQDQEQKTANAPRAPGSTDRNGNERAEVTNEVYSQLSLRLAELDGKIASAKHRQDAAQQDMDDLQRKSAEGPRVEAQYTALTRDYAVLKKSYDELLQRRESARIAEAADSSSDSVQFRIIAEPEEPAFPAGPKRRLLNFAVFMLSLIGGPGFVILLSRIEEYVTVPEDLKEFRNHIVLGCISSAIALTQPLPFFRRHSRFAVATSALCFLCLVTVAFAPNLSTVPQAIATRLALL